MKFLVLILSASALALLAYLWLPASEPQEPLSTPEATQTIPERTMGTHLSQPEGAIRTELAEAELSPVGEDDDEEDLPPIPEVELWETNPREYLRQNKLYLLKRAERIYAEGSTASKRRALSHMLSISIGAHLDSQGFGVPSDDSTDPKSSIWGTKLGDGEHRISLNTMVYTFSDLEFPEYGSYRSFQRTFPLASASDPNAQPAPIDVEQAVLALKDRALGLLQP